MSVWLMESSDVTRVFPGPSRSAYCPQYAFWVIFKLDWKTSEEKEENSCKTFDVKSRSFKMYHMQVSIVCIVLCTTIYEHVLTLCKK